MPKLTRRTPASGKERAEEARSSRSGAALLSALIGAMAVAILGACLMQTQAATARQQRRSIDRSRALYVAESGLAEASFQISQGKSGAIGSPDRPATFGGGVYWVESEALSSQEISLTCTARAGISVFRLNLLVIPNQNPVAKLGIFGSEGVVIGDRVLIDGYDSALGDVEAQCDPTRVIPTTAAGGIVGSNGDIEIRDGTAALDPFVATLISTGVRRPDGSRARYARCDPALTLREALCESNEWVPTSTLAATVTAGPSRTVLTNGSARVQRTGTRSAAAVLPEVVLPSGSAAAGGDLVVAAENLTLSAGSFEFESIEVSTGIILKLTGPAVIQVDEMRVASLGLIQFDDSDGPITIYVKDGLTLEDGSLVSSIGESRKKHGTCILAVPPASPAGDNSVKIGCFGDLRGIIYAPGHRVTIPETLRLYGSVIAKHVTLADGAWVTHDKSLENLGACFPVLPKRAQWRVMPVGASASGTPLATSSLPGADLTPEEEIEVRYIDAAGVSASFAGNQAAFNPALASRILGVRWRDPGTGLYQEWAIPPNGNPDRLIPRWRDTLRTERAAAGY